ncbi:hypothetical protein BYT27DRAFT_7219194, partial [Phlegmacium glaucopus]
PSGRLESLGETSKGIVKEARVSTAKEASNATEKVYTESESIARAKTFGPGTKRVTTSSSAKNLYYIEYLQLNEPITPAAFEAHWSGLTKDTVKKYMLLKLGLPLELAPLLNDCSLTFAPRLRLIRKQDLIWLLLASINGMYNKLQLVRYGYIRFYTVNWTSLWAS